MGESCPLCHPSVPQVPVRCFIVSAGFFRRNASLHPSSATVTFPAASGREHLRQPHTDCSPKT